MMKKISTIILLFIFQIVFGQEAYLFNSSNSQLPDDQFWGVAVDKKNNKWIGTGKSGLIKFKNQEVVVFNATNSKVKGEFISPIFPDSKGNIWISTSKPDALLMFNGENWKNFTAEEIKLSKLSIITITEDQNENLYFGGSVGITKFDGQKWEKIELPGSYTIRAIAVNDGEIAIGHNSGLLILKDGRWEKYTPENSELQNYVRSLKYINDDLYIGYGGNAKGGLSVLKDNNKWTHTNKDNSPLSDNMVRDIEVDESQDIWVATNNGLNKITANIILPFFFRERGNAIMDIAIENETVWVATFFGLIKIQ